jgi:hypothetical protein
MDEILEARMEHFELDNDRLNKVLTMVYNSPLRITEDMVLERIRDRYRWPKSYPTGCPTIERIARADGYKEQDFFSPIDECLLYDKFLNLYKQGHTFVISGVQYLFNDIATITDKLNKEFGIEINSNMYISKGSKVVSYPYHEHDYAVIIKNIDGRSKWVIDDKEYILEDQNVFFIDKFKWHCVQEIDNFKLSITFNLN